MPPRRTVTVVTPPLLAPVTLDEARDYAKLDDDSSDARLDSLIIAATAAAEDYTRRSFITRTLRASLEGCSRGDAWFPGHYDVPVWYFDNALESSFELPQGPVQSVTSITTYDSLNASTLYPADNYSVFGNRVVLNSGYSWPNGLRSHAGTEIIYLAGYGDEPGDVPRPIRQAILMHAVALLDGECAMPGNCRMLLDAYRVMDL